MKRKKTACGVKECTYASAYSGHLKSHRWLVHNVNDGTCRTYTCAEDGCDYTCKSSGSLKRHRWMIHNVNDGTCKTYACTEDGCDYTCKTSGNLKRHLWQVHNVNDGTRKTYACTEDGCDYTCKTRGHLKTHRWLVHNVNDGTCKTYACTEDGCDYTCKTGGDLTRHLWQVHNVNDGTRKTYACTKDGCDYTCKSSGSLKRHRWMIHNVNDGTRKTYTCTEDGCDYTCKLNQSFKNHLSAIHDIGDHPCGYCARNVSSVTPYTDPKTKTKASICRRCFKKATGYESRAEEQMVEAVKADPRLGPYVILTDRILKNDACDTRRRPDVLLSSGRLHLFVECDEHQHKPSRGYIPSCEVSRMGELNDEFREGKAVHLRWNPDSYKVSKGTVRQSRKERLEFLLRYAKRLLDSFDPAAPAVPEVHYMFYDADNEIRAKPGRQMLVFDAKY